MPTVHGLKVVLSRGSSIQMKDLDEHQLKSMQLHATWLDILAVWLNLGGAVAWLVGSVILLCDLINPTFHINLIGMIFTTLGSILYIAAAYYSMRRITMFLVKNAGTEIHDLVTEYDHEMERIHKDEENKLCVKNAMPRLRPESSKESSP